MQLAVVKDSEDVLSGAVNVFAQEEVGKTEQVVGSVHGVIAVCSHCSVSLLGNLLQLRSLDSNKRFVKVLELLVTDDSVA